MSSSPPPFEPQHVVGIVRVPAPPLLPGLLQGFWPIRTATEHPNGPFIEECFQHLFNEDAQRLRTNLSGVLDSQWWRSNLFAAAPPAVLDIFVHRLTGRGGYICQFCNGTYTNAGAAVSCVRVHINV
ncbi:hypothetical protein FRB91_004773 [Serendipita sp. 411]|nr:hypothetical protein FRC16_005435 [Serendipita sp. 398]KAG8773290.1 hypothetical protein FRC15_002107 [Serendipita sp. 397]KAG8841675.1 hypothetical protein FRB91_004773 [Serendipita sp. 411]